MKNKNVAGVLALLMGIFGVHRFYLGKRGLGVLYVLLFFITFAMTVDNGEPFIMAPAILGFIDAVLFFVMPNEEFDEKYNKKFFKKNAVNRRFEREGYRPKQMNHHTQTPQAINDPHKRKGIEKFRDYDFLGAIEEFQKSLQKQYDSPSTHFNLACCYSMLELPNDSFFHLEKAVEYGFDAFNKIQEHPSLAFLRTQPEYDSFIQNGYKVIAGLPAPQTDLLSQSPKSETDLLLDQLMQLGELREKGLLSENEFLAQKKKLLDRNI